MIDARISTGFPHHPKTKKLMRRLGTAGPLHFIWLVLWSAANRSDGDLSGMTAEDIELAADWSGEFGVFVAELVNVGFLDGDDGNYSIHDWEEHNPWAAGAEARSEKAKWLAMCKHHGREKAAALMPEYASRLHQAEDSKIDSATSMRTAGNSCAPSPSPSPFTKPEEANASLPSQSEGDDALATVSEIGIPACPINEIVALYHKHMPMNPKVKVLDDSRKSTIRARWRQTAVGEANAGPFAGGFKTKADGLAAWESFFYVCGGQDFLIGKVDPPPNRKRFFADLDFLLSKSGFRKAVENKYADDDRSAA